MVDTGRPIFFGVVQMGKNEENLMCYLGVKNSAELLTRSFLGGTVAPLVWQKTPFPIHSGY